ncbi:MAG: DUF1002 domain-containing protein [Peptoniphilaceae bacterium]|nr:DUF1002 domain-containing protein [Peptoniphilaceae bacterium]MDY6019701.1 DUF1002 domain-containing protein [Anaerococcus sp.]
MKKIRKKILACLVALSIFLPGLAYASGSWNWEKTTYIYGVALSQDEIQSVAKTLGLDINEVNSASVNGKDLEKYIGYSTQDHNMISSVSVKKLDKGSGIKINILTPDKIKSISAGQYTNAAITAGITDAQINVASPVDVTGESALVGVYKAVELNGTSVDTQRTEVAQDEIATLKKVSDDNKNQDNFDKDKLDQVVIDVKKNLSDFKKENDGKLADKEQIQAYIQDALKDVNMGDILSNNNIQILVNYFEKYQNTSAIDSKEVEENLNKLAKQIKDGASKIYDDNKEQINQIAEEAQKSGLWDQIVNFFKSIFDSIVSMFGSSSDNQ